jgi:hypothetical protein
MTLAELGLKKRGQVLHHARKLQSGGFDMNWDAISAIADILGTVVVGITLVYLGAQVRQGNILAKSQARQVMIEEQHTELWAAIGDPSVTMSNIQEGPLTEEEQVRLAYFFIAFLRQREWEWYQFQDGVISKDVYQTYHEVIPIHIGTPRGRKWWATLGKYAFNPQFVAEVDRVLANAPQVSYLHQMRTWDRA